VPEALPEEAYRDHVGIHLQKQDGLVYAGLPILRGRLTPEETRRIAGLAEQYGTGDLRTTSMQNLIVVNVPQGRAEDLARDAGRGGLRLAGSPFRRGTVACTGSEFCKLALTETKGFARWLVEDLEERLPGFEEHVRINITGCPNSCGQHWIADIGIEGKKIKVDGSLVDAYYFCVGGAVGKHQAVARPIGYRVPAAQVPEAMERLLRTYLGSGARDRRSASSAPRTPTRSCEAFWLAPRSPRWPAMPRPGPSRTGSTAEPQPKLTTQESEHDAPTWRYRPRLPG
jgi:sulfite reductase (ferredoxin)